jgi:hypothetical protein
MKRLLLSAAFVLVGAGCAAPAPATKISDFEECAAAGNPVMESYPRQCRADGVTYVEDVPEPAPPPTPEPEPAPEPTPDASAPQERTLAIGKPAAFAGGLTVTLRSIEDSRCPKDVQCVWAGELAAVLAVEAAGTDGGALELRLGPITSPQGVAYGYAIRLVSVTETEARVAVTRP